LRKLRQSKNKRQNVGVPSSATAYATGSPSPSMEILNEKRPIEGEHEEQGPLKVQKVGDVDASTSSKLSTLQPGIPAEEFIIPPAFGHKKLFDGKT
ncbi:hypothetical protein A2U01_0016960, partial [Trifolium medium]|nr:hypothetical protein [Trifolium medium]